MKRMWNSREGNWAVVLMCPSQVWLPQPKTVSAVYGLILYYPKTLGCMATGDGGLHMSLSEPELHSTLQE